MKNNKLYMATFIFIFCFATSVFSLFPSVHAGFTTGIMRPGYAFAAGNILFPLKTNDSVSATFGEYRSNHLHAGADFRTQRRNGIPVIAPSPGKIVNLYGDENGYGLMLTFEADNGFIYKFAHLSAFENDKFRLDGYVKKARAANNSRFNYDIDLSAENIRAGAGEIIAYSGDSGAGPPHLHFEINAGRRNDGVKSESAGTLNPFNYLPADELKDETPVNIAAAVLIPDDQNSLVEAKPVGAFFNFKQEGAFDLSVNAVGRIKILLKAFDENKLFKDNESKMGVYKIEIKEIVIDAAGRPAAKDGAAVYSLNFDSIDDKYSKMPEIVYDMYYSKISSGNFYYNMFYSGARDGRPEYITASHNGGIIEIKTGEKRYFQISAVDYNNNVSKRVIEITGSVLRSAKLSPAPEAEADDEEGSSGESISAGPQKISQPQKNTKKKAASKKTNKAQAEINIKKQTQKQKKSKSDKSDEGDEGDEGDKNGKNDLVKNVGAPGDDKVIVEYSENIILFKIKRSGGKRLPVIIHNGAAMKMFEDGGYCCYYKGYDEFAAAPEITVKYGAARDDNTVPLDENKAVEGWKIPDGKGFPGDVEKKYGLKIYKIQPGETVKLGACGSYMIKLTALSDQIKPFYAGEMNLTSAGEDSGISAHPAGGAAASGGAGKSSVDIGFSRPGFRAKIYYKIADENKISSNAGLYQIYSKTRIFMGNAVEEIDGGRYLSAPFKNIKRLSCAVFKDEKPPVLKISKKSGARLAKPLKLSAKAESNFLSFNLRDAESGVNRANIKYYIDGAESGNYEYFSGALLNCYMYDIRTGLNLSPGVHKIKIIAVDNSGNKAVYEKEFKIIK
jgi:hypothetical protein